MGDEEKNTEENTPFELDNDQENFSYSPNISSAVDEEEQAEEEQRAKETVVIDDTPIAEEDIHYRAENIQKRDDSKLFVNVVGLEKLQREAEREKRRQELSAARRAQMEEYERQRKQRMEELSRRAQQLKADYSTNRYKLEETIQEIWARRRLILAGVIMIVVLAIIPSIVDSISNSILDRVIADSRSSTLNVFSELMSEKVDKVRLDEIIKAASDEYETEFYDEDGTITSKSTNESISFVFVKEDDGKTVVSDVRYRDDIDDGEAMIYQPDDNVYYYFDGVTSYSFDNLDDAIGAHALLRRELSQRSDDSGDSSDSNESEDIDDSENEIE